MTKISTTERSNVDIVTDECREDSAAFRKNDGETAARERSGSTDKSQS